jgi:DNA-binding beta-propeller fold protein YncE
MKVKYCFLLLVPAFLGEAQQTAPLKVMQTIELSSAVKGPFDHFAIDLKNKRLFATPEDYKAVLVFDLDTGKVIHEMAGILRPHAVLYRADVNRIYVTDGTAGDLKVFDGSSYKLLQSIRLLKDADSIGFDVSKKYLYIDSGGKDEGQKYSVVSVVDTGSNKKIEDIRVDGETLEAMTLDIYRPRLYLNNKTKNEIEVLDRWTNKLVASWPVTMGKDNVAMALDEPHQRLFVGCRGGQMVVFDTNTGKELQSLPIDTGVDDMVYDAGAKRIYVAANGSIDVFGETDADHFVSLGKVATGQGAKTALLVPEINRYFVAVPAQNGKNATILVMEADVPAVKPVSTTPDETVDAPAAETFLLATMSAHPYLRKMGLHGIAPGTSTSVILANANATRIGFKTSDSDFAAVKEGKTSCARRDDGSYYNMKMPMFDATGRRIGILVMEIPYTSATGEQDAIGQAESLRKELAAKIPSYSALFQFSLDVSAPAAQKIVMEVMASHPEVQKLGVHAAPKGKDNVIIACNIPAKIGKRSSDADMAVVQSGKPSVQLVNNPKPFYDLALPFHDARGHSVGMIVMELRASAAKDQADALRQAERIRDHMQEGVSEEASLFAAQ